MMNIRIINFKLLSSDPEEYLGEELFKHYKYYKDSDDKEIAFISRNGKVLIAHENDVVVEYFGEIYIKSLNSVLERIFEEFINIQDDIEEIKETEIPSSPGELIESYFA